MPAPAFPPTNYQLVERVLVNFIRREVTKVGLERVQPGTDRVCQAVLRREDEHALWHPLVVLAPADPCGDCECKLAFADTRVALYRRDLFARNVGVN